MLRVGLLALMLAVACRKSGAESPAPVAPPPTPEATPRPVNDWAKNEDALEASLKKLEKAKQQDAERSKQQAQQPAESPVAKAPPIIEERPPPIGPAPVQWLEGSDGLRRGEREQASSRTAMFVYFHVTWCGPCKRLEAALDEPSARAALQDVIKVRIDPEANADDRAAGNQFGVKGYPSVFLIPFGSERVKLSSSAVTDNAGRALHDELLRRRYAADQSSRSRDFDKARAAFDAALSIEPNNAETYYLRGQSELLANEKGRGAGYLARALELQPKYPQAMGVLSQVYFEAGQLDDAQRQLDTMIEQEPGYQQGWAYVSRAAVWARKGDLARAAADEKEACRLGNPQACAKQHAQP